MANQIEEERKLWGITELLIRWCFLRFFFSSSSSLLMSNLRLFRGLRSARTLLIVAAAFAMNMKETVWFCFCAQHPILPDLFWVRLYLFGKFMCNVHQKHKVEQFPEKLWRHSSKKEKKLQLIHGWVEERRLGKIKMKNFQILEPANVECGTKIKWPCDGDKNPEHQTMATRRPAALHFSRPSHLLCRLSLAALWPAGNKNQCCLFFKVNTSEDIYGLLESKSSPATPPPLPAVGTCCDGSWVMDFWWITWLWVVGGHVRLIFVRQKTTATVDSRRPICRLSWIFFSSLGGRLGKSLQK